jgi:acyl-CoA synthetase (AMP-forming)/AMP-acid ligase II
MQEALKSQEEKAFFAKVPIFTVDIAADRYPHVSAPEKHSRHSPDWKTLLARPAPASFKAAALDSRTSRTRTAVILWSSGTSGRSKGVLLSHHTLNWNCAALFHDADFFRGEPGRWLGYAPFYHVMGLCTIMLSAVCSGSTVYTFPAFNLETVLKTIARRRITYIHMAPPVAVMLAKAAVVEPYIQSGAFSSVVGAMTGGAPLGHEVIVEVYRRLGFRVRMGYGLSETCSTSVQRGLSEAEMHGNAGDSGHPHWGVEIMIAAGDQEDGSKITKAAPIGSEGEILVRSPGVLTAYLPIGGLKPGSRPDMSVTMEALTPDGWFRTGDVGVMDATLRLRITDRLKELIKVRAFQVAPAELEAVLCSSEMVADAGVVGIYDDSDATEYPRAYVVARKQGSTPEELRALAGDLKTLVEQRTTRYKWLMGGIVFVDQIPKSPSGKILRRVLKSGSVQGFEIKPYVKKKRDIKKASKL